MFGEKKWVILLKQKLDHPIYLYKDKNTNYLHNKHLSFFYESIAPKTIFILKLK